MQRKNKMLYLQHIENNLEKNMKIHICIISIVCLFLSMSPLASYAGRTITVVKQSSSNSNIIKVGSYVDINSTFGPVTFSGNRIVLKGREVELHGNTTINTGSEFIIKNE